MSKKPDNDFCQMCREDVFAREMFIGDTMRILVLEDCLMIIQRVDRDGDFVGITYTEVPVKHCPMCGRKLADE